MRLLFGIFSVAALAATLACSSGQRTETPKHDTSAPVQKAATEKDPVCGMMVDPAKSEKAVYQGKTYYFCSKDERIEFEKNPGKYVKN